MKKFLIASLILPGFVACDKTEEVNYILPSDNIIRVSAGVDSLVTRVSATTSNLKEFGITVLASSSPSYNYSNVKATKTGSTWNTDQTMLWRNESDKVTIFAYAPYKEGFDILDKDAVMSILTDQTTEANAVAIRSNGAGNNYSAIIAPQTVVAGAKLLTIKLSNGYVYQYVVPTSGHTFAQETAYVINLRIGKDTVTLASDITVDDWTIGKEINGNTEIDPYSMQLYLDKGEKGKKNRANAYILPLADDVTHRLSIERIDDYWTSEDAIYGGNDATNTIASNQDMQIKILWADFKYDGLVTPIVSSKEKSMAIKVGNLSTVAPKGGNMVVAVTKANGTDVLWSWHLWFSDIAIDPITHISKTATPLPSGQNIMDRNLGATSYNGPGIETYGLLYQWGRKDGFPGSATSASEEPTIYTPANINGTQLILNTASNGSIALSIQNPFTFYVVAPGISDWATCLLKR